MGAEASSLTKQQEQSHQMQRSRQGPQQSESPCMEQGALRQERRLLSAMFAWKRVSVRPRKTSQPNAPLVGLVGLSPMRC